MMLRPPILCMLLIASPPLVLGQAGPKKAMAPAVTTVCKITDDPSAYNNKLVKVRGYVEANFEYSMLLDENCSERAIWFLFANGSAAPELEMYVNGKGKPGSKDAKGRTAAPIPVRLVQDSNFELLKHYWEISAKGAACADGPPPEFPPDCTTYRVTATFTGRIDSISKSVQEERRKRKDSKGTDGKGFGQMGLFDAQIVVQSVEEVVAVDEAQIRAKSRP